MPEWHGDPVLNKNYLTSVLAGLAVILTNSNLIANEWKPQLLEPGADKYRMAKSSIRIRIPLSVNNKQIKTLKLEIDNIDVSDLVKQKNRLLIYTPIQPLEFGTHKIRLIEYAEDGNIRERGVWTIEIKKSKHFTQSSYSSNIDLTAANRLKDKGLTDLPKRGTGQGSVSFENKASTKNWKFSTSINTTYNSQVDQTSNARRFDLDDYLFSGDAGRFSAHMGHHDLGFNNMIISEFNRRGLSSSYKSKNRRTQVTGFAMRTDTASGFNNGLGLADSNKITQGIIGVFMPDRKSPERFHITTTFINSKSRNDGEGDGGGLDTSLTQGGKAANLVIDSKNKHWRVRAELAGSEFDFDGINTGFSAEDDHAYSLLAVYTPQEKAIGKNALSWNLSVEHRRIGQFFKTLGNAGLPNDKLVSQAIFNLTYKTWSINTIAGTETDNTDDDNTLPTIRTNLFRLTANYSVPAADDTANIDNPDKSEKNHSAKKLNLFAQGNYTFNYARSSQQAREIPGAFTGIRTDNLNDIFGLSASFTPGTWSWSIGHTLTLAVDDSNDITENQANANTNLTELNITFPVGNKLSLNPTLQYNIDDNQSANIETRTTSLGIAANMSFSDKLVGIVNYSFNKNITSDNSNNNRTNTVDLNLTWTVKTAKNNKPGIEWFVKSNWQNPDNADDTFQVFTGIHIGWPISN